MSIEKEIEELKAAKARAHYRYMDLYKRYENLTEELQLIQRRLPELLIEVKKAKTERDALDKKYADKFEHKDKALKLEKLAKLRKQVAAMEAELSE